MPLESSHIPLPTLTLMVFSVYIYRIVVIKCVGIPLLDIIIHSLSLSTESKACLKSINATYVGMLNSLCFSVIWKAENMQSMQALPFLHPFCSSNSKTSAITVNLFAINFEYILYIQNLLQRVTQRVTQQFIL